MIAFALAVVFSLPTFAAGRNGSAGGRGGSEVKKRGGGGDKGRRRGGPQRQLRRLERRAEKDGVITADEKEKIDKLKARINERKDGKSAPGNTNAKPPEKPTDKFKPPFATKEKTDTKTPGQ